MGNNVPSRYLKKVHELTHDSFYELKDLAQLLVKNFTKNTEKETAKLTECRVIKVHSDFPGVFFYKNSYSEANFKKVEIEKSFTRSSTRTESVPILTTTSITLKKAYKQKLPILEKKKAALLNLVKKNIIPQFYATFYNSL